MTRIRLIQEGEEGRRLIQEGIDNEDLAVYTANAVLSAPSRKSLHEIFRIARKSKTMEDVDETMLALKKYDLKSCSSILRTRLHPY